LPGIVGLITRLPRHEAEGQLARMLEALRHESFYVTGTWIDESQGVYLGWIARKNSFSDGMPLRSEDGEVVLVFSGEEYSQARAPKKPSYLLHLYDADPSFPAGLNGRFHGLVTDRKRGTATLFNDRFGMHRTYFHEGKEAFYFSAEAKGILAVRPELASADLQSLGELVACGCVLENRTLFKGIHVLPGAANWVFRNGSIERKGRYFRPAEWEDQPALAPEAYYREVRDVFSSRVHRYFNGEEGIGMSLTGGLDTRMIMAWKKSPPGALSCYSFGATSRECQDVLLARKVAHACGQPHEVIPVGDQFLSHFPRYAERSVYLTDGCAGVDRATDLYLNERARQIASVRMTGNYGGEVLRRVRAFKPVKPLPGLFRSDFLPHVSQAEETYTGLLAGHPLSFAVFKQAPWHHYGLLALEQTQLSLRSPFLDNDFVRTVFRAPEAACASDAISLRLIADGDAALMRIRTDRGVGGDRRRLPAAVSRRLLDLTFKAEYAYDHGMPQWVARIDHRLSALHLERLFLGRHKFAHFRVWYRDALSSYVRDMLLDPRTLSRPYLHRKTVELVVNRHLKGDANYTSEIHQMLTLELVHRLFLDAR
jgi:asparagine synthase (glutamine-hydrolysing)